MVIMMAGIIFTEPDVDVDFARGFQKYIILGVLSEKLLSGTSPYLEDILHPPEVPNGDHDGWSHLY